MAEKPGRLPRTERAGQFARNGHPGRPISGHPGQQFGRCLIAAWQVHGGHGHLIAGTAEIGQVIAHSKRRGLVDRQGRQKIVQSLISRMLVINYASERGGFPLADARRHSALLIRGIPVNDLDSYRGREGSARLPPRKARHIPSLRSRMDAPRCKASAAPGISSMTRRVGAVSTKFVSGNHRTAATRRTDPARPRLSTRHPAWTSNARSRRGRLDFSTGE